MAIVNIGILAHVDAGKTTLTERILYETGVIKAVGSVDRGTTQTDTMELERTRGITIKAAVTSFQLDDLKVNLIDTPGHGDFIAEVGRSLGVLDGVVLVISAVEGVQSQTRRLAQAVRSAQLPMLIFVNKIDRVGARAEALLADIRRKLKINVVALNAATGIGARTAEVHTLDREHPTWREPVIDLLAETEESVIEEFERTGGELSDAFLGQELRAQIGAGQIVPAFFGSAVTGVGVPELLTGVAEWLPTAEESQDTPVTATVFKITRQSSGEKIVFVRLFAGSLAARQSVVLQQRTPTGEIEQIEERITGIVRFVAGVATQADVVSAGDIASLHGLRAAQIGDRIGAEAQADGIAHEFPVPTLESSVRPVQTADIAHLRSALEDLAEQDPLISLRQRNNEGEISVRLYGEVQKEVMLETLAHEYGIAAVFQPSQTICIERPVGTGEHIEIMGENENPIMATVGVRIEAAEPGSGIRYVVREMGSMPPAHYRAVEETIYATLSQGLFGWEVTDCVVTLTDARTVQYSSPTSTAGDFRKLTPLVVMQALRAAGTEVCEPIEELDLDIPEDTFGAVCGLLVNARGTIQDAFLDGPSYHIICEIPTMELRAVEQQLPGLTRGEAIWMSKFARYGPVPGDAPSRKRVGPNPLNRAHYLADVT